MKNKLKKLLRFGFTLFTICLFLTNCEKENVQEEPIQVENQEPTFTLKHYSRKNIEKNTKLVSKLKEFNDKVIENKSGKYSGKNVYNKEYDFTIYTDSATYIQNGNYHSYTFPIIQGADEKITNVMFELNDQNEYDAFLVRYDYSANELKYQDFNSLSMKTSMKPIDLDFNSLFARTKSAYVCVYSYEYVRTGSHFTNGDSNLIEFDYGWVLTAGYCETVLYYEEDYKEYHQGNTATVTIGGTTYGGTGGSTTSPTPSPFDSEELMKINVVKSELNLKPLLYDSWINSNAQTVFEIYNFLVANLFSAEALTEAKMRCDAELANYKGWDFSITGTFPNRPSLKYKATYTPYLGEKMYLLDNGLVLYQSATKRIINKKDAGTLAATEYPTDGYNYIYSYSTKRWYEYRMPPPSPTAKADIDFLLDAFWTGVKIAGRYATPLEDAIILIDGKDFDGGEQSRAISGGFLMLEIVPGSKLLKPIGKGIDKVWKVVIKNGDKVFTRTVKELTEETLQHFERYAPGTRELIDEALRKGDFLDDEIIIEVGQEIADLSAKKGRNLTWEEVKVLFKRGHDFNEKARDVYKYNEVTLKNGKRLDSYMPGQEIISRKATTLVDIKPATFKSYLQELITKYPKGAEINAPKFKGFFDNKVLDGDYFLEIPLSNRSFFENSTIFQQVLTQFNVDNNVLIRIKYLTE
ncbi:hypothetical protein CJ739_2888 [Mariniflexile rhizosphaerae]|uniref:hypothetical protein n=1 Tax=unclassified Mariniflexile TaxID=2643887 RepID=UPI000CBF34C1|nr:hypothetical protein [Mariniflexile sp. TRM1-10]AXP81953.1 hypothetical protein CJ739_2888 [Mariniflexile sp. TRM1-10]PLB18024.1 MAG: hypothetical protein TRG1_3112 [Flavobacteriaceae bacterium FS1-H7996/R]